MNKYVFVMTLWIRILIFSGSLKASSVLLDELVTFLNTTHSVVAWAMAIQNGLAYIVAPLPILLLKLCSIRSICIFGGVISGLGYIFCGITLTSTWHLFTGYVLSGVGLGLLVLPTNMLLQKHFDPNTLPTAIAVMNLFDYIGIAVLPMVLQVTRERYGLHNSLIIFGAIVWNTVVTGVASTQPGASPDAKNSEAAHDNSSCRTGKESHIRGLLLDLSYFLKHKHAAFVLLIESIGQFVFVSWALFLVPVGRTAGLSELEAVSLTAFGGVGGFIGRVLMSILFCMKEVNIVTSIVIPLLLTGVTFFLTAACQNYYVISGISFICGLSQSMTSSSMFGLMVTVVCPYHFKMAIAIESLLSGFFMQLAGVVSGSIRDYTGSVAYIFMFNGVISLSMTPVAILWAVHDVPNLNCDVPFQ